MSYETLEARLKNVYVKECQQGFEANDKWGMQLKELYKLSFSFFREKSGKALHLSYQDNLKLIAFAQQAANGAFNPQDASPLGVFDVIGRDRRIAWQSLGEITKFQAMEGFINLLDRLCPTFKLYIEAVKKDNNEKLLRAIEDKRSQEKKEKQEILVEEQKQREELTIQEETRRRQLQEALNQQTYHQFKTYAEKQFLGNPEQQATLIKQLQNEHYHQYIQQLQSYIRPIYNVNKVLQDENISEGNENIFNAKPEIKYEEKNSIYCYEAEKCEKLNDCVEHLMLNPARMWTRTDIKTFKQQVSASRGDGVIHVGHGDTITVRVPTNEEGTCIFWEFATDNYDIGFGVYFEWGKPLLNEVTVHVSESDDELYEEEDDEYVAAGDLECGLLQTSQYNSVSQNHPPISIIVPVYRRECQNEVYVGSHIYPGEGVYLLKFDNSFSIWRSKTLYYRIFYER